MKAEREKLMMKELEGWKKLQVKSMDQVVDVLKTTTPLEYPAAVTDEIKAKMTDLLQRAKDGGGGVRTNRALKELEKIGQPSLFFIANQLREINYKDTDDAMFGMQLNNTMQNITMGVNTGYVPVAIGEEMDPRKAQWNAMTVQQWHNAVKQFWPTEEKFKEYITNRKAKKDAELESELKGGGTTPPKTDPKK